MAGYPGWYWAQEYIRSKFSELGLVNTHLDEFNLTVPIDHNTSITILAPSLITLKAYTLFPNLIQTCSTPLSGVEGHLIYVGKGELSDFNGLDVEGSIVLMEFNSKDNWLNAAKLGAKAVIFLAPNATLRLEAEYKTLVTPLHFPRVYVEGEEATLLRKLAQEEDVRVKVTSRMFYEEVKAVNIVGAINGSLYPNELIILAAHYDTYSVVPALAPGADEATGIATLLELARFLSRPENRPKRTVIFVALASHWQQLAGAREFVHKYYFSDEAIQRKWIIGPFIALDFSTDSEKIAGMLYGNAYVYDRYEVDRFSRIQGVINNLVKELEKQIGLNRSVYFDALLSGDLKTPVPMTYMLDSEPATVAGCVGITFRTAFAYRLNWYHPLNTYDIVNFEKLKPQLAIVFSATFYFAQLDDLNVIANLGRDYPRKVWGVTESGGGFYTLIGRVEEYDEKRGWYTPVKDAIVDISYRGGVTPAEAGALPVVSPNSPLNPYSHWIVKANEKGEFIIHGLPARQCTAPYQPAKYYLTAQAFVINATTGEIEYAPDLGEYGDGAFHFTAFLMDADEWFVRVIVFKCIPVTIFDLLNPQNFWKPELDPNYHQPKVAKIIQAMPYDFTSHGRFLRYGIANPSVPTYEGLAILFVKPETRFEVLLKSETESIIGVVNNATKNCPDGYGYFSGSRSVTLYFSTYEAARNLFYINEYRLNMARAFYAFRASAEFFHGVGGEYLALVDGYLKNKVYDKAYESAHIALNNEINAYFETKSYMLDIIQTTVFFFIMLLPFSIVFEKFVLHSVGRKTILNTLLIFIVSFFILYSIHPGFHLASNVFAVLLGFTILSLSIPIIFILLGETVNVLKELRRKMVGLHFAEASRMGTALLAFSTSLEYMRKRRLRTILNLCTLIVIIFSLVSLTSASVFVFIRSETSKASTPYNGLFIDFSGGKETIPEELISVIRFMTGPDAIVSPRAWLYGPSTATRMGFVVMSQNKEIATPALVGLSPLEINLLPFKEYLSEGSRWFTESDGFVCILTKKTSDQLGVKLGNKILISGIEFTVIGIVDGQLLDQVKDLNGEVITPFDPSLLAIAGAEIRTKLPWDSTIIVPYEIAKRYLGASIYSVSVKLENITRLKEISESLVMGTSGAIGIYSGFEGMVNIYRRAGGFALTGWQFILAPIIICCLVIFNTMLSAVFERTKEITVFSAVGLSPRQVSFMFLAEALAFALVGSVLGYVGGIIGIRTLVETHSLPVGFYPNYSSIFIAFAIGLAILAAIGSTAYPVLKASMLVTPSLERAWAISTKPKGNLWEIPLPFSSDGAEVDGVFIFMHEFLSAHYVEGVGPFILRREVEVQYHEEEKNGEKVKRLSFLVALPPYEVGIRQLTDLIAQPIKGGRYQFHLTLKLIGGMREQWLHSVRPFADTIRKQLLIWRGLKPKERELYIKRKIPS
jgi:ABC-type antimicrobial peptide transport system permease subunit